ncbi:MAG: hypothetical protein GTO18_08550 [Anaerolineales bacterium]|nr:hypothetical protein [Anaerolineales bacterium]
MLGKLTKVGFLVLILALLTSVVAYAEEDMDDPVRLIGEITAVDTTAGTFSLEARNGASMIFHVAEETNYRSIDGSIKDLGDLQAGMKALVIGKRDANGGLVALMVAAGLPEDLPNIMKLKGVVEGVDLQGNAFALKSHEGEILRIAVGERTRYRSRDGSVEDLSDLNEGMRVQVGAVRREDGSLFALLVAASSASERPQRFKVLGEITQVIPGQNQFEVTSQSGDPLTITVNARTTFRSRDGSIDDIHDLKKGMKAIVVGFVGEEGQHIALIVGVADPEDPNPKPPQIDVKTIGRITSIGDHSFNIETRNQGNLTFTVTGSTVFKSRDGSVDGFDDLQVGMIVGVGAKRLGNGDLMALVVGVATRRGGRLVENPSGVPSSSEIPVTEFPTTLN